jgi:hypothetical protein
MAVSHSDVSNVTDISHATDQAVVEHPCRY